MSDPNLLCQSTPADALNEAGGLSYQRPAKEALAQIAATGCLSNTFYAQADQQLDTVLQLIQQVNDNVFLAKLALYSRERAMMKDMPAALCLALARRDRDLFRKVFPRVVDNGRVLRTLFSLLRSGRFGSKGMSYAIQSAFQSWLNRASVGTLLSGSIGNDPSLRDVMRLARPTPVDNARRALFGWLTGRPPDQWAPATLEDLPPEVRDLNAYRHAETEAEQVEILQRNRYRWDLLVDKARGPLVWEFIARQMGPQALRMNLNTLERHRVLDSAEMVEYVATRLADPEEVRRSRQFPYQYLAAYLNAAVTLPPVIRRALETAAELACGNVPVLPGPVVIGLDVSGSMGSALAGSRGGHVGKMRCVDAAALFAAAVLRRNPQSVIIPFDTVAHQAAVQPTDSILSLAQRLSQYGGGGTNCSIPLTEATTRYRERRFAGCVLVSDNESWVGVGKWGETAVMSGWRDFQTNQVRLGQSLDDVKLVCIDLQPYTSTQAPGREDILNVGGFSDAVFEVVNAFLRNAARTVVSEVEAVELPA